MKSLEFVLGLASGILVFWLIFRLKKGSFEALADKSLQTAELEIEKRRSQLELALKEKEFELKQKNEIKRQEILKDEKDIERKIHELQKKQALLEKAQADLNHKKEEVEKLLGMSEQEAKQLLLNNLEKQLKSDMAALTTKAKEEATLEADRQAASIISTAINRLSGQNISELAIITVFLPSEEMKGRIIGREGRNIRLLEELTGVNFLIEDSPNAVVISGFDPIRKQIAKMALTELLQDGRIHPTRIEEVVDKSTKSIERIMKEKGENAAKDFRMHPILYQLLGKLYFISESGQNLLDHSIEVSRIMALFASELKIDTQLAKKIGLLHDIGKAVCHEKEGSHALIGYETLLKYGENEQVANGVGSSHSEMAPLTIEASLCPPAEYLSSMRPGARSEAIEHSLKRQKKLEELAYTFAGVERAYSFAAGKELRVVVEADKIDDRDTINLARKLTQKIEQEATYSGKIKVTVIREKKAVDYAK